MQISLFAARKNIGLTQKEVAEKLGIHLQTVGKYEKDSSKIPMNLLQNMSNLYNIPINDIFLGNRYELKHK